jgi:chromosome segregation ATPase
MYHKLVEHCRIQHLTEQLTEVRDDAIKETAALLGANAALQIKIAADIDKKDQDIAKLEQENKGDATMLHATKQKLNDVQDQLTVTKLNAVEASNRSNRTASEQKSKLDEAAVRLKMEEVLTQRLEADMANKENEIQDLREQVNDANNLSALKDAEIKSVQVCTHAAIALTLCVHWSDDEV